MTKTNSSFSRPEAHFKSKPQGPIHIQQLMKNNLNCSINFISFLQPTSFLMNKVTMVVAMATNKCWSLGCLCASLCCHGDGYEDSHIRST